MKILIVHQHFNTPDQGGAIRSYYIATGLREKGYQVEVITAHQQSRYLKKTLSGVTVHYLPVYYDNSQGFWSRVYAFARFAWLAWVKAKSIPDISLCYTISTPLTAGWVALRLKRRKGIPFVFEVGDLWPEAPMQMGVLKNPWLIRRLRSFERKVYREARQVVALSPDIKQGVQAVAPECQVSVVPNMCDCDYFQPAPSTRQHKLALGLPDKFLVLYFGTIGKANHLEFLIEAAKCASQSSSQVHFVVAGKGSELARIKRMAKGLSNITFLGHGSKEVGRELLLACDANYISYADIPVLSTGSPNKFFDGLAAGKLTVLNIGGWLKELAERDQLGIYVNPYKPQDLHEKLQPFVQDASLLGRYQKNARRAAEEKFSKKLAIEKLQRIIDPQTPEALSSTGPAYTLTG